MKAVVGWLSPRKKAITAFATPWVIAGLGALAHKLGIAHLDIPANTTALFAVLTTGSVYTVPNSPAPAPAAK